MKVIIEKEEVNDLIFDQFKTYVILRDFNVNKPIGTARVSVKNGIMYADLYLI